MHDNFPPEAFKPFMEMAFAGEFGPAVAAMAADRDLARSDMGLGTWATRSRTTQRRGRR